MGERTWVMLDLAIILRSVQSLYVVELKSHAPSTLYPCEMHATSRREVYYQPNPSALLTDCLNILLHLVASEVATP